MKEKLRAYMLPLTLAVTVLISIVLSVTLLVDPVRFGGNSGQNQSASLKNENVYKGRSDIYSPIQVIQNSDSEKQALLVSESADLTGDINKEIGKFNVNGIKRTSRKNQDDYFGAMTQKDSLLLNYGGQIPVKMISDGLNNASSDNFTINRIVLPLDNSKKMYLLSDDNFRVCQVDLKKANLNRIHSLISSHINRTDVQMRLLNNHPIVYCQKPVQMKNFGYLMGEQSQSSYINRILGNSADTRVTRSKDSTGYSSDDQTLTFDKNDDVTYNNYNEKHPKSYEGILDAAYRDAVKLGYPLENLSFDNYNPKKKVVTFRSFLGGFPIYSERRLGTAAFTLGSGNNVRYEFSQLSFEVPIPTSSTPTELPDTGTVLDDLEKKGVDVKKVSNIVLGYQAVQDQKNHLLITLKPSWFIKVNGNWINWNFAGLKLGKESF